MDPEGHSAAGPVVFVLDDDVSVRRALTRLLRSAGMPVETFASARDFLAVPPRRRPACLVLDLRLPDRIGLDLLRDLAVTEPDLPIVVITGQDEEAGLAERVLAAGATALLRKPFDDVALLDAVQRALAGGATKER